MTAETRPRFPLIGMTLEDLTNVALQGGMQKFVGRQLADWLYKKRVRSFDEMINISIKNREWLGKNYEIGLTKPREQVKSEDDTVKYLFRYGNVAVESVLIPDKDRSTLCISSQAGCRMNCYFCATGRNGYRRNLTANEIINQVLYLYDAPATLKEGGDEISNVVFMGMGEPLDNYNEVHKTIEIMTASWGLAWSPRRITVSTVGVIPHLKELIEQTQVHVAISLHTPNQEDRGRLMPAQRAYPLTSVINLLKGYDFSHQRRLSFEYIMWRGVNDDIAHAEMLVKMLKGLDCRVNIIRFHSLPGVELKPASEERMLMFRNYLNSKGIIATIRASRGEDIMAACGMLAGKKNENDRQEKE